MINNRSNVTGVTLNKKKHPPPYEQTTTEYWAAKWRSVDGKSAAKHFSISKHGYDGAFQMAIDYRKKKIEELRNLGFQYSEDHGERVDPTNAEEYVKLHGIPKQTYK